MMVYMAGRDSLLIFVVLHWVKTFPLIQILKQCDYLNPCNTVFASLKLYSLALYFVGLKCRLLTSYKTKGNTNFHVLNTMKFTSLTSEVLCRCSVKVTNWRFLYNQL